MLHAYHRRKLRWCFRHIISSWYSMDHISNSIGVISCSWLTAACYHLNTFWHDKNARTNYASTLFQYYFSHANAIKEQQSAWNHWQIYWCFLIQTKFKENMIAPRYHVTGDWLILLQRSQKYGRRFHVAVCSSKTCVGPRRGTHAKFVRARTFF